MDAGVKGFVEFNPRGRYQAEPGNVGKKQTIVRHVLIRGCDNRLQLMSSASDCSRMGFSSWPAHLMNGMLLLMWLKSGVSCISIYPPLFPPKFKILTSWPFKTSKCCRCQHWIHICHQWEMEAHSRPPVVRARFSDWDRLFKWLARLTANLADVLWWSCLRKEKKKKMRQTEQRIRPLFQLLWQLRLPLFWLHPLTSFPFTPDCGLTLNVCFYPDSTWYFITLTKLRAAPPCKRIKSFWSRWRHRRLA